MKAQISGFIQIGVVFGAAGLMSISYAFGFQMLGIAAGILLSLIYFFGIRRSPLYTVENT